ncbi:MAG: OB-fold domain-containing protein [Chloroflexi bacterium]|nr:OB-fold domain-containing protein [Chloroflexota bacterium]
MLDQESQDSETLYSRAKGYQSAMVGTVYSYTLLQEPPLGYESQAPYYVALVELDDGGLVTAQLTDIDGSVQIGDRVEMVTRKLTTDGSQGMIVYGYKFRPAL